MLIAWSGFIAFILFLLALDLGVFNRKSHVVSVKEALGWSAFWMALGLSFSAFVYFGYAYHWFGLGNAIDPVDGVLNTPAQALQKYLTGYVVEYSLSVDNIFVIAMIFSFFRVPPQYQHRVLFWGVLGALVMRGAMIAVGAKLVAEFHWVLYVFAAFLIFTAIRMLVAKENHGSVEDTVVVKFVRRFFPVTTEYHGEKFSVLGSDGKRILTPLAMALILVETTDLIFAVDSIPAIFAITAEPFLVFTSNVFAIMGLRSLYFALAGLIHKFRYLKVALALVLLLVGLKMIFASWLKTLLGSNFNLYVLAMVVTILLGGVLASLWADRAEEKAKGSHV